MPAHAVDIRVMRLFVRALQHPLLLLLLLLLEEELSDAGDCPFAATAAGARAGARLGGSARLGKDANGIVCAPRSNLALLSPVHREDGGWVVALHRRQQLPPRLAWQGVQTPVVFGATRCTQAQANWSACVPDAFTPCHPPTHPPAHPPCSERHSQILSVASSLQDTRRRPSASNASSHTVEVWPSGGPAHAAAGRTTSVPPLRRHTLALVPVHTPPARAHLLGSARISIRRRSPPTP